MWRRQQRDNTPQQDLAGEVALVTGASSGIGAATARELARRGASVVLAARRADRLEAQVRAITRAGGRAVAVPTDLADPAQVARLAARAVTEFGRVDVLCNNAGVGTSTPLAETPHEEIERLIDVNLRGAVLLTRAVLPGMLARRHGAIISVASVAGHVAFEPLYSATKFGLRGFSLALSRRLAGSGVSASLVSPGFIRTPMTRGMWLPMPGPELVARTIADLVRHPRREVIVPRYYALLVWIERLCPWLTDRGAAVRRLL